MLELKFQDSVALGKIISSSTSLSVEFMIDISETPVEFDIGTV